MAKARIEYSDEQQKILTDFVLPIEEMLRTHIKLLEEKLAPVTRDETFRIPQAVDPEVSIERKNYNSPEFIKDFLKSIQFLGSNASLDSNEQDIYRRADQLKTCYGLLMILQEGKEQNYKYAGNGLGLISFVADRMPASGFPEALPSDRMEAFRLSYIIAQPMLNSTQESIKGFFSTIFKTPAKLALTNNINAKVLSYEQENPHLARKLKP